MSNARSSAEASSDKPINRDCAAFQHGSDFLNAKCPAVERKDRLFGWGTRIRTSVDGVRVTAQKTYLVINSTVCVACRFPNPLSKFEVFLAIPSRLRHNFVTLVKAGPQTALVGEIVPNNLFGALVFIEIDVNEGTPARRRAVTIDVGKNSATKKNF